MSNFEDRLKFISGFDGPVGNGLITQKESIIWADMDFSTNGFNVYPGWEVKDIEKSDVFNYIHETLPKGSTIAANFSLFDLDSLEKIFSSLGQDYLFVDDTENLIEGMMVQGLKINLGEIVLLDKSYSKFSPLEKYEDLCYYIGHSLINNDIYHKIISNNPKKKNCYRYCIPHLDDFSWILNMRTIGNLLTPFVFGYGVIYHENKETSMKVFLIQKDKYLNKNIKKYFTQNKIEVFSNDEIYSEFMKEDLNKKYITVIDRQFPNSRLYNIITQHCKDNIVFIDYNPLEYIKSIKNITEIENIRKAMIKESLAYIKLQAWIDNEIKTKGTTKLIKSSIISKYKTLRQISPQFLGECSDTVILNGKSSCIILPPETQTNQNETINLNDITLINSNAQYLQGTTEITRTFHYGTPTPEMKEMYTRILLGLISLERLHVENEKFTLENLDCVARSYLSQIGEDYPHLTCHGIGSFLNIREGPDAEVINGNVFISEPGFYKEGEYGMRIENMYVARVMQENVKEIDDETKLTFENLTFIPYEKNLIDFNLMSYDNVRYIDKFHSHIFNTLKPYLQFEPEVLAYLREKTASIF